MTATTSESERERARAGGTARLFTTFLLDRARSRSLSSSSPLVPENRVRIRRRSYGVSLRVAPQATTGCLRLFPPRFRGVRGASRLPVYLATGASAGPDGTLTGVVLPAD